MGLWLLLIALLPDTQAVEVQINGIKEAKGQICIAVYDSPDSFMKETQASKVETISVETSGSLSFSIILPQGNVALAVFHDLNSDKTLNKNLVGFPTEPYGFSKNPKITFGPPSFDESKIPVDSATNIQINLN